eukprot:3844979-Amphidinium_carterae.1
MTYSLESALSTTSQFSVSLRSYVVRDVHATSASKSQIAALSSAVLVRLRSKGCKAFQASQSSPSRRRRHQSWQQWQCHPEHLVLD